MKLRYWNMYNRQLHCPLIVAHNGFDNTLPNSIASIRDGLEAGADFVEIDVRSTKDNIAVLFHDNSIETEAYGAVSICKTTLSELNKMIRTISGKDNRITEIVTLEEAVRIVKDLNGFLNIDLKDEISMEPMIKVIRDNHMADSVVISGCNVFMASYIKKKYPEFQVMLNIDKNMFLDKEKSASDVVEGICKTAVKAACSGINIQYKYLSDELIEAAGKRYLPISIWTLTDQDELDNYLNMNLYSITTLTLKKLLEKRKKMKERIDACLNY